jgi:K+-transporting ATPase ATPase A chain
MLAILLIPAALWYTFGVMVKDTRQGWALLVAMTVILAGMLALGAWAEQRGNPALTPIGVDQVASDRQPGGNMEGKETRFDIVNSVTWAAATTAASNGSVHSMHDSYTPLGGLVPLLFMLFGEVVFGGIGSGLYGMIVFAIIAVFVAGLMVGRTPEYLGKKIEPYEMKMASLLILIRPIVVLGLTAVAVVTEAGTSSILNPGAHGFSEILYAFGSQGNNNGSAFAALNANTPF